MSENRPEISPTEIELEKLIGEGTFGKVYRGKCRGKEVAIKVFKRQDVSEEDLEAFREEVKVMSQINHPNIILFMGACTTGDELMLVTTLMPMDLDRLFLKEKREDLSLFQRIKMLRDAALGMRWLHESDPIFIHRDLKLSNLLVDSEYNVYVCDFGLTQMKPRDREKLDYDPHGSPLYMAPEVFEGEFDEKCDIYSFGLILWEALVQEQAFAGLSDNLPSFIHAVMDLHERPKIPKNCPRSLRKLISDCWSPLPTDRPAFQEIIGRLDKCLVDIAIQDDGGRRLMKKKKFLGKLEVPLRSFLKELARSLDREFAPDTTPFKCVEAIVGERSTGRLKSTEKVVTLVKLGQVLAWFGGLDPDANEQDIFHRIEHMLRQRWFHGDIAAQKAMDMLTGQLPGTFLVRFSSQPGCFTISSVDPTRRVVHQRVIFEAGQGYVFWNNRYPTLKKLLQKEKKKFGFLQPCPDSKYMNLFEPGVEGGGGCYVAPAYMAAPMTMGKDYHLEDPVFNSFDSPRKHRKQAAALQEDAAPVSQLKLVVTPTVDSESADRPKSNRSSGHSSHRSSSGGSKKKPSSSSSSGGSKKKKSSSSSKDKPSKEKSSSSKDKSSSSGKDKSSSS
eukprot:CAMPEP_0174239006 /NCGR_PEP_ID=MMETSP0417-20130205/13160_1 /TAXON_ID=242541 /ORGANISM="Mayorella sp, Strain BSH-02190019" /LENGTH=614 /DNA_ID=CAMNT_0015317901 /DNA_START=276 /DNA_END=2116 /DNA_ORIENTATION=-